MYSELPARIPATRLTAEMLGTPRAHTSRVRPTMMIISRWGSPTRPGPVAAKKPGTVARIAAVTASRRHTVPARAAAQPSANSQNTTTAEGTWKRSRNPSRS
jgi:hypothetical protein